MWKKNKKRRKKRRATPKIQSTPIMSTWLLLQGNFGARRTQGPTSTRTTQVVYHSEVIRIHRDEHCYGHTSNELPSLGVDQSQDNMEHGYYDEDDDSDYDLDDAMRHFVLMANLRGYMAGGKEWVLEDVLII